jgi:hypothetical protein
MLISILIIANRIFVYKKDILIAYVFIRKGPIIAYSLSSIIHKNKLNNFFEEVSKLFLASILPSITFERTCHIIDECSFKSNGLEKIKEYYSAKVDNNNNFMSFISIMATIISTLTVGIGVYLLTIINDDKQRELDSIKSGYSISSYVKVPNADGTVGTYDFDLFMQSSVISWIFFSLFFIVILALSHYNSSQKSRAVLSAINFKCNSNNRKQDKRFEDSKEEKVRC